MRSRLQRFVRLASAPTVALAVGLFLYLGRGTTRAEAALGFSIPRGLGSVVHALPRWIQDTGPDAAWSIALASLLSRSGFGWRITGFAFAAGWEIGQGFGFVRGTFDPGDLGAIALAYVLTSVIQGV